MIIRLFSCIACLLLLTAARSAAIDTAAVRPNRLVSNDLHTGRVWISDQGLVPGLEFARWGAAATRITFSDDPAYSRPQFDARWWAKADHLDSLITLDSSICWIRFHFKPDKSLDLKTIRLRLSVLGRAEIWLDGMLVLRHERSHLGAAWDSALDTNAFFSVPLRVQADGETHVLALRLEAAQEAPPPLRTFQASLHRSTAAARMHRGAAHLAVFFGVNAFILVMAILFWRMDTHDRIWPWFAALTGTNAFIAFTELVQRLDMGFARSTILFLEDSGAALRFTPFCLSVLLLVVILGKATRRTWLLYVGSAIVFTLVAATVALWERRTVDAEADVITTIIIVLVLVLIALVPAGWFLVETVRLGVRVIRSSGFQRWIGAGVLVGSLIPILLPVVWILVSQFIRRIPDSAIPEELQTTADYIGYIALPLSIITALAIRTTHQNKLLARQRDDLDKEVHERTAELRQERDRSETLLLNILPQEVAEELKATGAAEAKHFDQATVLFTDFKGFTAMSEKVTPVELLAELNSCFRAFDDIIARRGIEKIKTIGDAYMCVGGLPDPKSSAPIDVVLAALEMQEFMTKRSAERSAAGTFAFEMRSGINTGPVVAGIVGVKKFQYDIWGDTVNLASRMETSGEVRRVNISAGTYVLVKDVPGLAFIPRGAVDLKGKGATEMWFVERA